MAPWPSIASIIEDYDTGTGSGRDYALEFIIRRGGIPKPFKLKPKMIIYKNPNLKEEKDGDLV